MRIFWKIPIKALPDFIFQWVLYQDHLLSQTVLKLIRTNEIVEKKTIFIQTNQPFTTSFYIKRYLFFAKLAMSQQFAAQRAREEVN